MPKKAKKSFQSVKGMADILPQSQPYWEYLRQCVHKTAQAYGFERIDTPIVEDEDLFKVSAGETSDIVQKQMYSFKSKGGDNLVLRPEGTAPIMRSYIEHGMLNLPQPLKLYYMGPFFRYEQPQGGRYRQFYQFGFEVLGEESPVVDAQLVNIFINIMKEVGFKNIEAQVNSIGCKECRPKFRSALVAYYKHNINKVCKDCRKRVKSNPLRVLDCKDEKCLQLKQRAPQTLDYLCDSCQRHFKYVLEYLDELEIPYALNPHLVRGLDYYTKTVFEFFLKEKDEAQPEGAEAPSFAVGGGGRFDALGDVIGNKKVFSAGMAGGMERIVYFMKKMEIKVPQGPQPHVFIAQLGDMGKKKSLKLFENLRSKGIRPVEFFGKDSIKSQLRIADKMGIKHTLILGQKEALDGNIILRDMESGIQELFPMDRIVDEIKKRLKK
jgi:histidyl-tRNA synthetase